MNNPKIDSYQFGQIMIDGETYSKDLIITPGGVKSNWWRREGHSLCLDDLESILTESPNILILGTGAYGQVKINKTIIDQIESTGIKVIIKKTEAACEIYNKYAMRKKVIAALHLTC